MKEIYVDGSYSSKSKRGGIGLVVVEDEKVLDTISQEFLGDGITNNRMELKAIITALMKYGTIYPHTNQPIVYSDSAYAVNSFTSWIDNWEKHGWKTASGKEVENIDLMKTYFKLKMMGLAVNLKKCEGHSGNKWNDLADKLAKGEKVDELI